MNLYLKIIAICSISILIYSCQSAKDALQGKKRSEQSDEFLVEKKNPLTLPPDFESLPIPGNQEMNFYNETESSEIKELLINTDENNLENTNSDQSESIESNIIKKIQ